MKDKNVLDIGTVLGHDNTLTKFREIEKENAVQERNPKYKCIMNQP
jgi:hypothetical protein